jgi:hypothetical protein
MAKDHSNQGGGYDGGDPDAEIARLAAEDQAEKMREANRGEQERIAEAQRRQQQEGK